MSIYDIISSIVISGIFTKSEDLEILPPPPPFPDVVERAEKEDRKATEILSHKRESKKKTFNFFRGIGLVKTEQEKKDIQTDKKDFLRQKEVEKRKKFELEQKEIEKRKAEKENQRKEKERAKQEYLKNKQLEKQNRIEARRQHIELKREERTRKRFEKINSREEIHDNISSGDVELDRELDEIEGISKIPKLVSLGKDKVEPKTISTGDEIRKAIGKVQKGRKPSAIKDLLRKKELETIETPEVMPKTYDKIDYLQDIEEKMHKSRLALMDFKFKDAKMIYIEIMKAYNLLEPKEKSKVYNNIKDLYYERKTAEKYSK